MRPLLAALEIELSNLEAESMNNSEEDLAHCETGPAERDDPAKDFDPLTPPVPEYPSSQAPSAEPPMSYPQSPTSVDTRYVIIGLRGTLTDQPYRTAHGDSSDVWEAAGRYSSMLSRLEMLHEGSHTLLEDIIRFVRLDVRWNVTIYDPFLHLTSTFSGLESPTAACTIYG